MTKDTATDRTGQTPAKREYDPLIRDLIVKTQALRFGVTSDEMAASLDALQTHVEALQRRGDDNLGIAERSITQLATSVARGEALQAKLEKALAAVGPLDLESPDGEQALDATAQALWEKVAQLERGDRRAIAWAQAGDEERTKWRSLARSSIFAYETARARVAMLK